MQIRATVNRCVHFRDAFGASLDVQAAHEIEHLLLSLAGEYPLVVVSHSPEQAVRLASRLVVFEAGRVCHEFSAGGVDAAGLAHLLETGYQQGNA